MHAVTERRTELARWKLPAVGVLVLVALYLLAVVGVLPIAFAFVLMGALAVGALFWGVMRGDTAVEDTRADLGLCLMATWAVIYVAHLGLTWVALMGGSWVVFIGGTAYLLFRGESYRWIPLGAVVLVLVNLVLFFALWRP